MPATYQHFKERFPGLEFDWFATDAEGNIGLFVSAGFGPVPIEVQLHFQDHDLAASRIDWRLAEVWEQCAELGLFVFDWQHWQGPYLKIVQPSGEIEDAFKQQILDIPSLIVFDVVFGSMESVGAIESE